MEWQSLPTMSSLRAFAAVAERGGFSQAGRALNVSHAAVGQQVHALERHLGTPLVFREGRGLALTPAGAELARALGSAFADIAEAVGALTGSDAARPLSITSTPAFASGWLMPRIADFRLRHPEIELAINPTPTRVDPTPGGVDLAIRHGDGDWSGFDVEPLIETPIVVVGAPSLVRDRVFRAPADLMGLPWLKEPGPNEVSGWLAEHGVVPGRRPRIRHLPGHLALEGARRGEGISAGARVIVEEDIAAGRLVVLFQDSRPGSGYHVVTRRGVMRPALREFLSWLRRQRPDAAV